MKHRGLLAWGFVIAILSATGAFLLWHGCSLMAECVLFRTGTPINMKVDLSATGKYTGVCDQPLDNFTTYQRLGFRIDPPYKPANELDTAIGPLSAVLTITDDCGSVITSGNVEWYSLRCADNGAEMLMPPLTTMLGVPKGTWRATLEVCEPAPALTGYGQTLVSRYVYHDGLNHGTARLWQMAGAALLVVGAGLALVGGARLMRDRRRARATDAA